MTPPPVLQGLAYGLAQAARVGWFYAQYRAAQRLAPPARDAISGRAALPAASAVLADLRALLERDWANIRDGVYKAPWDMRPSPRRVLRQSVRFFADLSQVTRRRRARSNAEPVAAHGGHYPRYYLQNFHYQSGGYLTDDSAELYDYQVEVLFAGGADAMRRQALVPLRDALGRVERPHLLDLACGTGRFLSFVRDNWPGLRVSGVDLSPAYLARARRHLAPWDCAAGRPTGLVQANAEALPFADASLDAVSCVYLFHELPGAVRARVAAEIARVLKPGGTLVFVDSLQTGDAPAYDGLLEHFPRAFHEPYYADYCRQDLPALFATAGLHVRGIERAFFSKLITAERCTT